MPYNWNDKKRLMLARQLALAFNNDMPGKASGRVLLLKGLEKVHKIIKSKRLITPVPTLDDIKTERSRLLLIFNALAKILVVRFPHRFDQKSFKVFMTNKEWESLKSMGMKEHAEFEDLRQNNSCAVLKVLSEHFGGFLDGTFDKSVPEEEEEEQYVLSKRGRKIRGRIVEDSPTIPAKRVTYRNLQHKGKLKIMVRKKSTPMKKPGSKPHVMEYPAVIEVDDSSDEEMEQEPTPAVKQEPMESPTPDIPPMPQGIHSNIHRFPAPQFAFPPPPRPRIPTQPERSSFDAIWLRMLSLRSYELQSFELNDDVLDTLSLEISDDDVMFLRGKMILDDRRWCMLVRKVYDKITNT